jgi:HD-like signal output (HDOD) protein
MEPAAEEFVTVPPPGLPGWVALFDDQALPVLEQTAWHLETWRQAEEAADAHTLADVFGDDPLFTVKLLAHVARLNRQRGRECGDIETVTEALVMLGIGPFFRAFGPQPAAEARVDTVPGARAGFDAVLSRSRRAARFALAFAAHRVDYDAPVLHGAALLHDFAELLLWQRAPALALAVRHRQEADCTARSAAVQREILNIELAELQHALMLSWGLPTLLVHTNDDHARVSDPQSRTVQLAIRIARHSAAGWDNAALPDDIRDLSQLLQLAPEPTQRLLLDIDAG